MTQVPSSSELQGKEVHLDLVGRELDREITSYTQRSSAMEQRATILIGAASVVGALQVTTEFSWFTVLNLALSFVAAAAGVVVVFPRRGPGLNVRPMRRDILDMSLIAANYKLIDTKLEILEADEHWLSRRGRIARVGFIALAASIAIALWAASTPVDGEAPNPSQTVPRSEAL